MGNKWIRRSFVFYGFIPSAIPGNKSKQLPRAEQQVEIQSLKQVLSAQPVSGLLAGGGERIHTGHAGAGGVFVFSLSLLIFKDCDQYLYPQHRSEVRQLWLGSCRLYFCVTRGSDLAALSLRLIYRRGLIMIQRCL